MRKYRLQELTDLTGLTHGYVRDLELLSIDETPLLETTGKFADALEIDIRQLFDDVDTTKYYNCRYAIFLILLHKYTIIQTSKESHN